MSMTALGYGWDRGPRYRMPGWPRPLARRVIWIHDTKFWGHGGAYIVGPELKITGCERCRDCGAAAGWQR